LFVTNGNVSVANTILANGGGSRGTLVLSGPTVVWSNSAALAIGNASNTFGNTLVISNSARMDVAGSFRLGSGSSQSGSSDNTLLLDTGGKLTAHTGPVVIGHRSTGVPGSHNNTATVQGGAAWDNGNSSMVIGSADGGAATGNVLTVGASGFVTNVSQLTITAGNTLNLLGGLLDATMTCTGTVQGFGTVLGDATIEDGGFLSPFNSQRALIFSNKLILASTATTTVQLGTNTSATVAGNGLTLGGTLNITDGGGFTTGTYTIFTYNSTLTDNGLTIGTTPNSGFTYTIDTSASHAVNLVVSVPATPPAAVFTGSPTLGAIQLVVTFTDNSTGTITNRFWNFGDGATTFTTATNLMHTYASTGTFDVALTVFGPLGNDTQTQSGYITATNVPLPSITAGVTASNAALQIGNLIVVVAGDTNTFSVGATDPNSLPLTYQWLFGDGVTNAWPSSNTVDHAYTTTNCEAFDASVTISNGVGTITSNFTIVVACPLNLAKLAPKLNFAKTNSDSCTITGSFDLPDTGTPSFAGKQVTLDIGGGSLTFTLPAKGSALNGRSKFSTPTFNKKTGQWKLNVSFKNGFWQTDWANYGMINSNISKPGVLVSDLPVILLLDGEAFMATTNLHYTAKQGKSGTAKK
jgi:PKD repeat protein